MPATLYYGSKSVMTQDSRPVYLRLRDMIAAEGYDMVIIIYSSLFQVEYNSGTSMYDFR